MVIYPNCRIEPTNIQRYQDLLTSGRVNRIYLDELGEIKQNSIGIATIELIIAHVLLWQVHNPFHQTLQGLPSAIFFKVIYSQDSKTIAITETSKNIFLVSVANLTYQMINADQAAVTNLSLHPTQNQFLSAGENGTLKRWDMTGKLRQTFSPHNDPVMGVAWHPNGRELVSSTFSGQLFRWSSQGQQLRKWSGHPTSIWDVAYSPDGSQFASAGADGTARLWSRDGQLRHTLNHDPSVWRVAFSPNGSLIATSSVDETVKLWTLEGKLLVTLKGHGSGVRTLVFRKDGQILTSVGDDGSLVMWNVATILKL